MDSPAHPPAAEEDPTAHDAEMQPGDDIPDDPMPDGDVADDEAGDVIMKVSLDPNESNEPEYIQDVWADEAEAAKMNGVSPDLVAAAKTKELAQLKARMTFDVRDRRDLPSDMKIVGTRWVLVNKGSLAEPVVKARLVCQEFATYKDMDLFSGTPALAAFKLLIADLARNRGNRCAMLLDVTGAFLYGTMRRQVGIRLLAELNAGPDAVGLLRKSLYGLRDAPLIWQQHIAGVLRKGGFEESPTAVGLFRHTTRQVLIAAHVDDVLATGTPEDLCWLRDTFAAEYELKSTMLGPDFAKEGFFLKRRLQWSDSGLTWTADPKHAQQLVQ